MQLKESKWFRQIVGLNYITVIALTLTSSSTWADIQDEIKAAFAFNAASGSYIQDLSAQGHDGTAMGNFAWENEKLHLIAGASYGWASIPRGTLLNSDWSIDMWLEVKNAGVNSAGRIFSAATDIGGTGPEWFFRNGLAIAMRINNQGATWDIPLIGTRSNPAPPDHWALPTQAITANTVYHVIYVHESGPQRVKMYQARAADPALALVFDGTYSGTYAVSVADLRLSHSHRDTAPRYVDSTFYQLLLYDRVFNASEITQSHQAGPDSLSAATTPLPTPLPTPSPTPSSPTPKNEQPLHLQVYPNPASQRMVYFHFDSQTTLSVKILLFNTSGELVSKVSGTVDTINPKLNWDTDKVTAGLYFYQVSYQEKIQQKGKISIK